jgi:hypothetical protein
MANYRPSSSLTALSKVIETTMYHKLNHHLQVNNILVAEQYGIRKGLSTENASYTLVYSILQAWNRKFHVGGIFCDLAKAFDCVSHEILMMKLQYFGLQEQNINWFKSYVTNRKQRVKLNINNIQDGFYTWETKTKSPSGVLLGPLLFIIYICSTSPRVCCYYAAQFSRGGSTGKVREGKHWISTISIIAATNRFVYLSSNR